MPSDQLFLQYFGASGLLDPNVLNRLRSAYSTSPPLFTESYPHHDIRTTKNEIYHLGDLQQRRYGVAGFQKRPNHKSSPCREELRRYISETHR